MYKIIIEQIVGEVAKKTTIETDDVELVKAILVEKEVASVHSDVDNLNIDPEWQELMQWYKNQKRKEADEKVRMEKLIKELNEKMPKTNPGIYISPFTDPDTPWASPFTVTC